MDGTPGAPAAKASSAPSTSDQRPAASGGPRAVSRPGRGRRAPAAAAARALPAQGAQRRDRVVGDLAGPDQVPQRIQDLAVGAAPGCRRQRPVEARPALAEVLADPVVELADRPLHAIGRADRAQDIAARPDQHDPAVVAAEAAPPHPGDLAHRAQLVEQARLVAGDAGRQHVALQHGRRDGHAGQLVDDLGQALQRGRSPEWRHVRAGARHRHDALPGRQEPGERRRIDRLDLAAQPGQRAAAQDAQHVRVAPLALGATRPELATQQGARREQALQGVLDDADRQAQPTRRLGRQERAVGPGVARQQALQRALDRAQERIRARRPAASPRPRRGSGRCPRGR